MAPQNLRDQGQILFGSIARYNADSGRYYVKYPGMSGDPNKGFPAMLLSPVPFTDGGGIKAVPKVPLDTPCVLYRAGERYVILGFQTPDGAVVNDTHFETRPIKPGESFQTHNSGTKIGFTDNGSVLLWASMWLNAIFNPVKRKFTAWMQNMIINWTAGYTEYTYKEDVKTSKFVLQIHKDVDFSPVQPGAIPTDRVKTSMGVLDESHVMEVDVKQNYNTTLEPGFAANIKLGKQTDGTWFDISSTDTPTAPVIFNLKADTTGKVTVTSQSNTEDKSVKLILNPAQSNVVELTVNKDKAVVTIDAQGNITLKQTDAAKLYLGGKDKAQQLVTKKWIDLVFKQHMHPTAGTGPPSAPIVVDSPVSSDSATNVTTYTTLAE